MREGHTGANPVCLFFLRLTARDDRPTILQRHDLCTRWQPSAAGLTTSETDMERNANDTFGSSNTGESTSGGYGNTGSAGSANSPSSFGAGNTGNTGTSDASFSRDGS